jgi:hypothetical protein
MSLRFNTVGAKRVEPEHRIHTFGATRVEFA